MRLSVLHSGKQKLNMRTTAVKMKQSTKLKMLPTTPSSSPISRSTAVSRYSTANAGREESAAAAARAGVRRSGVSIVGVRNRSRDRIKMRARNKQEVAGGIAN